MGQFAREQLMTMKTINKPADNLGGLIKIWAIPSNVFTLAGKTISISDLTNVYQIYCSPESMAFKEPNVHTKAGTHYSCSLTGFVPKDSESNQEAIAYIEPRDWVVIFQDGNGKYKAAGTSSQPLRASFDLDTKSLTSERAGFGLRFVGNTTARAVFVNFPF